jgi:6-phosphofructokinase 1
MVCYDPPDIGRVSLAEVVGKPKLVPLDCDTVQTARQLGISLGD